MTGSPTAPTRTAGDNSTKLATTAYVDRIGVQQIVSDQDGTFATITVTIPSDNSKPQITEGEEVLSVAITPKSATSKLVIQGFLNLSASGADNVTTALFQDAGVDAIYATGSRLSSVSTTSNILYTMISGTTSAITFSVRVGANSAIAYFNGPGSAIYNGVGYSTLMVTEIGA
jgi:hypothetical protein